MKLLTFDAASRVTGYAVMADRRTLIEAGRLRGKPAKGPPCDRIWSIVQGAIALAVQHQPDLILVEVTSGKVQRRHKGGGAGLGVHGMACGALFAGLRAALTAAATVKAVTENEWTRGVPKAHRAAAVASLFPSYRMADDPGLDIADAIGLGHWWYTEAEPRGEAAR